MSKIINIITAVLILMFMAFMLVFTVWKGCEANEKCRLEGGTFERSLAAEALDGFMTGNFFGGDRWIKFNADIREEIGEGSINGVYVRGGMLLDSKTAETDISRGIAKEINRFSKNYKGAVYFTVIPTSSGVYGEKLPPYFEKNSEMRQINALYDSLDGNIRKIDACNILKTHNNNYIYYRSDTKWTGYGAYCVYRTVIQKLGFTPSVYDKYTIRHLSGEFRGNLYLRTGCGNVEADIIDAYDYSGGAEIVSCVGYNSDGTIFESRLYDKELLDSDYIYDVYLGREAPMLKIGTSVKNERRLLVIKDSYADCFVPFLTQHYSEITVISPELIEGTLRDFVNPNDYEQTLFLFGIENLGDSERFEKLNNK